MDNKLISICIPAYNGGKTISRTLDAMVSNIESGKDIRENIEIIVTDDCSGDNTVDIVTKYTDKYDYIKFFQNDKNLGMDGNFKQVALNAKGKYIWYSGQDDIFLDGSVEYVIKAIKENPEVDVVNINFSQYSEQKNKYVCKSMLDIQSLFPRKIEYNKNLLFNGAAEYFSFFDDIPSFLPSIIMKRDFWVNTDTDKYIGTYFIQYATILLNIKKAKILAITKPVIRGLIPSEGWQTNGNKLFSIQLGIMKARELVYLDSRNPFPKNIFYKKKRFYLRRFLRITIASKNYYFFPSRENKNDLKMIYGDLLYYFYLLPVLFFVRITPHWFIHFIFNIKQKI